MRQRPSRRASPAKGAVHEHVRQMLVLERLCSRFHRIAQQLQSRLRVADEGELVGIDLSEGPPPLRRVAEGEHQADVEAIVQHGSESRAAGSVRGR